MALPQFAPIVTTVPLTGTDVFDPSVRHLLPVGAPGAILEVWDGGTAYEVEIFVGERDEQGLFANPTYCLMTLRAEQIRLDPTEAAWVARQKPSPGG